MRWPRASLLPLALLSASAMADDAAIQVPANRTYVAVVVGITSYASLPDDVELDHARADAANLARTLKDQAGFDEVFLLGDGEATKEKLLGLLRGKVAQLVGPDDVLVFYFEGHGIGADFNLPVLLAADSTMENGQEDGLELSAFARDFQTWITAGTTLIVTDAIHRNQLDGIYFFGPAASDWPRMPQGTMILSATQAQTPSRDGAFAPRFSDGIAGKADQNGDKLVTASELFTYLVGSAADGELPVAAGDFESSMVLSQDVRLQPGGATAAAVAAETPPPPPEVKIMWPEYSISAAKFVWETGSAQTVQCRDEAVVACDPSCYVRNFKAGPCHVAGVFEGTRLEGETVVLGPGKYDCARKGGELSCVASQ